MKYNVFISKTLLVIFFLFSFSFFSFSQPEPDFIGRINLITNGKSHEVEMKEPVKTSKLNAGAIITSIFSKKTSGKAFTYFTFQGIKSPIRVIGQGKASFIIKVRDNNLDPTKHIVILKLKWDPTKDVRYFQYTSKIDENEISTVGFPQEVPVPFNTKKFGLSSYIITVENLMPGEYAIYSKDKDAEYCGLFGVD
ncbi:MAG: hypothetical protein JST29_00380 [Bacteroidetes bacterium]|nr:hypothetical protein [Bacteroidota bacterium]MBS1592580.1 hypothetical protein [Bacteroidota bacterium]